MKIFEIGGVPTQVSMLDDEIGKNRNGLGCSRAFMFRSSLEVAAFNAFLKQGIDPLARTFAIVQYKNSNFDEMVDQEQEEFCFVAALTPAMMPTALVKRLLVVSQLRYADPSFFAC